jgi:hypothetical protein
MGGGNPEFSNHWRQTSLKHRGVPGCGIKASDVAYQNEKRQLQHVLGRLLA